MNLRPLPAALLALALIAAAPLPPVYTSPAGSRIVGAPNPNRPYDVILPSGRIAAPVGRSVVVGMNPLGVALSPDGKYAILTNDDERDARGGYSLSVVNTATMRVTDVYAPAGQTFFLGVVALKDPAKLSQTLVIASSGASNSVEFLRLDRAGKLHAITSVAVPGFPGSLALSANHRIVYAVSNVGDTVSALQIGRRRLLGTVPVGYFPYGAVVWAHRLYVTDPGLAQYTALAQPLSQPQFANVAFAPTKGSALSSVPLTGYGDVSSEAQASTPMDEAPDGVNNVGGAAPTAITISKDGHYAYVCMTNVDRIAIVDLLGVPRVINGLQLRLFDKTPYGAQPDAIVRSPDGTRLYVALAGLDAVAVLDARNPRRLHRLGLIPTGWYPSAIAVSKNGRYLYVANARGNALRGTLQRIDMHNLPLKKTTLSALRYLRVPQRAADDPIVPPLRSGLRSRVIQHVVFILEGDKTYDSDVTPNLHELASEFGLAANMYADAAESDAEHQFAAAGIATAYTEKTALVKSARSAPAGANEDPEDYPRSGYIFNSAARAGISYRDYGDLMHLSGYDPAAGYTLDVPGLAALKDHVDLDYPGPNSGTDDVARADAFIADYTQFERENAVPQFTDIYLPEDGGAGSSDRALGMIVDFLTHQPSWSSTAMFITPDAPQGAHDHVSAYRTYAIVVSPYAKHRYQGNAHLSTVSVLKTEEELLGLQPLALGDLLATDMSGFFTAEADLTPFTAITQALRPPGNE